MRDSWLGSMDGHPNHFKTAQRTDASKSMQAALEAFKLNVAEVLTSLANKKLK